MSNLNRPDRDSRQNTPPLHVSTRNDDTLSLTWLIGLATAIVAGGYLFLAESTRDDLKAINVSVARPAQTVTVDTTPVAAYSLLAEPPAELRN